MFITLSQLVPSHTLVAATEPIYDTPSPFMAVLIDYQLITKGIGAAASYFEDLQLALRVILE